MGQFWDELSDFWDEFGMIFEEIFGVVSGDAEADFGAVWCDFGVIFGANLGWGLGQF